MGDSPSDRVDSQPSTSQDAPVRLRSVFDGFRGPTAPPAAEDAGVEGVESTTKAEPTTVEPPTVELPMTQAMRSALAAQRPSSSTGLGALIGLVIVVALVLLLAATNSTSNPDLTRLIFSLLAFVGGPLPIVILLGIVVVLTLVWQQIRSTEIGVDITLGTYLRTTCRAILYRVPYNGGRGYYYHIKLIPIEAAPKKAAISARHVERLPVYPGAVGVIDFRLGRLGGLDPALWKAIEANSLDFSGRPDEVELKPYPCTAEYAKHSHLLLSLRDANGKVVYRLLEYHAE